MEMMLILFSTRALDKQATHSFNPIRLLSDNCTNTGGAHRRQEEEGHCQGGSGEVVRIGVDKYSIYIYCTTQLAGFHHTEEILQIVFNLKLDDSISAVN